MTDPTAPSLKPDEQRRGQRLKSDLAAWQGIPAADVRLVRSPYRACPVGAHVDHQLGCVTGMALDRCILMAFAPRTDGRVVLRSEGFEPDVAFDMRADGLEAAGDWADYARGAVAALHGFAGLGVGMTGLISGHRNAGGLSSSAAVGVAYLLALEDVNGILTSAEHNVELDRIIENDFIGLNNGILDQSIILRSRAGHLTFLDCLDGGADQIPFGGSREPALVALFSGLRTPLCDTDYNRRVRECAEAAQELLRLAGLPLPAQPVLRRVPEDVFTRHGERLPPRLRRRALHFFGEQDRVARGVDAWRRGDLEAFGRAVTESGRSSVDNYECGNPYLRDAFEIIGSCDGVYGARFSGAGFRGCCIGVCEPEAAEDAAREALAAYRSEHPDMADAEAYVCRSSDAAAVLE
jgi:galactokinase